MELEHDNCLRYNLDMYGSDLRAHDNVVAPEHCQKICDENWKCLGFTWVGSANICHLKPDSVDKPLPFPGYVPTSEVPGVVSGFKNCGNGTGYKLLDILNQKPI